MVLSYFEGGLLSIDDEDIHKLHRYTQLTTLAMKLSYKYRNLRHFWEPNVAMVVVKNCGACYYTLNVFVNLSFFARKCASFFCSMTVHNGNSCRKKISMDPNGATPCTHNKANDGTRIIRK